MLTLPTVTLLAIDTIDPLRTIRAMRYTLLQVKFAAAVLVTDPKKYSADMMKTIGGRGRIDQITVHFVAPGPRSDYEVQIVAELPRWFKTDFCLFHEWDSAVINPGAWNPDWLGYDFIGAPWPYDFNESGFPKCTRENCVGNGGFSLRSRDFCKATGELLNKFRSEWEDSRKLSDAWISRTIRPQLAQDYSVSFAPEDEALKFSCENRFYNGQFGLHGKGTIAMNGWKWDFDWLR